MTKKFVPRGECPLNLLAKMGKRITNAWIYFHDDVIQKLEESASQIESINDVLVMRWQATEEYPETELCLSPAYNVWFFCSSINAEDIPFTAAAEEPKRVIFLQMGT